MTTDNSPTAVVTGLPLKPGLWTLDESHSSVTFAVRHLGLSKVRGRFNDFDAVLHVGDSLGDCRVDASIAVASVDTGNSDRDNHVRSPEMLDVETHPAMHFTTLGITGADDAWKLEGEATIAGVTRPFVFDVEFNGLAEFFDGTRHAGFVSTGQLRRKDFGLDFGGLGPAAIILGDVVSFELDLQFVEPADDPAA